VIEAETDYVSQSLAQGSRIWTGVTSKIFLFLFGQPSGSFVYIFVSDPVVEPELPVRPFIRFPQCVVNQVQVVAYNST